MLLNSTYKVENFRTFSRSLSFHERSFQRLPVSLVKMWGFVSGFPGQKWWAPYPQHCLQSQLAVYSVYFVKLNYQSGNNSGVRLGHLCLGGSHSEQDSWLLESKLCTRATCYTQIRTFTFRLVYGYHTTQIHSNLSAEKNADFVCAKRNYGQPALFAQF